MKKRRNKSPRALQRAATATADAQFMSGYDAANQSTRRGQIWWPTLDTRKELDSFTRSEINRRVRWLVANVGGVRALVRNGATLVGWVTPQAASGDFEWDRKAEKRFADWANRKSSFSRCGKYHFENAQLMLQRCAKKDGDVFTVLTTTPDGKRPMLAFYESHQLASPPNANGWVDGVKVDAAGLHLAYGFRSEDGSVKVINAASVIYYGEFDSPGHVRALSPLAHAVNHAIDITEIRADTKLGIKSAALFGVVVEKDSAAPATKAARALGGTLTELRTANGAGESRRIETREVFAGGQMPELNPGEKLNTVHDARPSPNQMEFEDELWRDISIGYGLPPEILLKMTKLTGPGVRFVMDYASRWIGLEHSNLWDWAERVWWHFLAFETQTDLGFPETGNFMDVSFIPQRDLTIDRAKDGRQRMEEIDRGLGTWDDWHRSISGASGRKKIRERIDEVKDAMDYCKEKDVPYETAFPPRAGAAPANNTPAPEDDDDDQETPTPATV